MSTAPSLFTQEDLIALRRLVALSPYGGGAVVEVQRLDAKHGARYVSDLWHVATQPHPAPLHQLTRGESQDRSPTHDIHGDVLFLSDRPSPVSKSEREAESRSQIWRLPMCGGEPECVSEEPLGVMRFCAAADADVIVGLAMRLSGVLEQDQREIATERSRRGSSAIRYTSMPVRSWDHWIPEASPQLVAWRGGERVLLTCETSTHAYRKAAFDVSADGAHAIITRTVFDEEDRLSRTQLELHDLNSGEVKVIFDRARTQLSSPRFTPDGEAVIAQTWERAQGCYGAHELVEITLATCQARVIPVDQDIWPNLQGFAEGGAALIATADWQGATPALRIDRASGAVTRLTSAAAGGTHTHVCLHEDAFIGLRSSLAHPPELFRVPVGEETPMLITSISGFDPEIMKGVEVSSERATSSDGSACQYWRVSPTGAAPPLGRPVLMWVHGGPISHWGDTWHWRWNSLIGASQGYIMALPNPRGSTGFGQSWVEGIWGNTWGGQCHDDLMAVVDHVETHPDVRDACTSVMGGSFGGYMTSWIGTQHARFRALVTHAGLYNLTTFHAVTDMPAYWAFMMGQNPHEDHDAFSRYSPHRHVSGWSTPTLIVHGQQDYRVPVGEALALFDALQHHGVESELLLFPDENHWILKPRNIAAWYDEVFNFLHRHAMIDVTEAQEG